MANNDNSIIRVEQNGIEYFTLVATGESGLSHRGLARLSGKALSTIQNLIENLTEGNPSKVVPRLKTFIGQDIYLTDSYRKKGGSVLVLKSNFCFSVIRHYDKLGSEKAEASLDAIGEIGLNSYIQGITKWLPDQYQSSPDARKELSRIMSEKRKFHPLFGDENVDKIAKLLNCARNSAKLAKWFWEYIYYTLSPQERADLDRVNPVINGRRKDTIHQWLEESATNEHRKHFDQILFILRVSNTEQEFRENFRRMYSGYFQQGLFE